MIYNVFMFDWLKEPIKLDTKKERVWYVIEVGLGALFACIVTALLT